MAFCDPTGRRCLQAVVGDARVAMRAASYRSRHIVVFSSRRAAVAIADNDGTDRTGDGVVVAFDGRLDNRSEVAQLSGIGRGDLSSNADLALAAYLTLGGDFLARLEGDFRALVWNEKDRELLVAVDFAGVRRMWWRSSGDILAVASEIRYLYRGSETPELDEDYFCERVMTGWSDGRNAAFRGVSRLLPGEALRYDSRGVRVVRYWRPETLLSAQSTGRSDADCVEEFGHMFRRAVAVRLPNDGPVYCDLSGGLDSTTVTAVAAGLLGTESESRLHAITHTYPDASESDETESAVRVAAMTRARHHLLPYERTEPIFGGIQEHAHYWEEPTFGVFGFSTAYRKAQLMRSGLGASVLSGFGAEISVVERMKWPIYLSQWMLDGRWGQVAREIGTWRDIGGLSVPTLLFRACLLPILSPRLAARGEAADRGPKWATDGARRQYRKMRNVREEFLRRGLACEEWVATKWRSAGEVERGYGEFFYETRHPFLDKPLAEAILRMPWTAKAQPHASKILLRRAARKILPEGFSRKASKGADQAICQAFAAQSVRIAGFTESCVLADLGLVEPKSLRDALIRIRQGVAFETGFVLTAISLELWARSVVSGEWFNRDPGPRYV